MVIAANNRFIVVENSDEERRVYWWRPKSCSKKMSLYKTRESHKMRKYNGIDGNSLPF